jgi:G3E family GTPase
VRDWLARVAPGVPIVTGVADLLGRAQCAQGSATPELDTSHDAEFESVTLRYDGLVDRAAFLADARAMTSKYVRAKGRVTFADEPGRCYVFQLAGERWSLEPSSQASSADESGVVVAIAPRRAAK